MIALLLAVQLSAQPLVTPRVEAPAPSGRLPGFIRTPPSKGLCAGNPGHLEVSLAEPAALYRRGDRPPKGLRDWVSYPNPRLCLVEASR